MNSISMLFKFYQLKRNQWLEKEELERLQLRKLKRLLTHAYNNVPYYHKLFKSVGLKPEDITSLDDFSKIPITRKEVLKKTELNELIAKGTDLSKCINEQTTGTSGIPLQMYWSKSEFDLTQLIWTRTNFENGASIFDKKCSIVCSVHATSPPKWFQKLGIWQNTIINNKEELKEQIAVLKQIKPDHIIGYPSSIALIAREVGLKNIKEIRPRKIFTSAELLDQKTKKLIIDTFGVNTFDLYGCAECGLIAWECEKREGYHINIDNVVLEILNDGKPVSPGEPGEIICTNLNTYTMPFIRYAVDDIGTVSDKRCSCGRTFPMMKSIEGRTADIIILKDGILLSPTIIMAEFSPIAGIFKWQFIQEEVDHFKVLIVPDSTFNDATKRTIKEKCCETLGNSVRVDIALVDEIPNEKSGKFRLVKSNIAEN